MHYQYHTIKLYDLFQFRKEKPASGDLLRKTKTKKFNFGPKIGCRSLAEGKPATPFSNWRRWWDSNPRELVTQAVFKTAAIDH